MRFVLESTNLVNETNEERLVGTVPYKSKYLNSNSTTSLLMLQVIPDHPHGVSSLGFQLDKATLDPFRLCFQERRASPCGLTAKATKGFKREMVIIVRKEKRVFHGFTGITAMLQSLMREEESTRRKRVWLVELRLGRETMRGTKSCLVGYKFFKWYMYK